MQTQETLQKSKSTFTLHPSTKKDLFSKIPSTKRSRFVDGAIKKALKDEARMKSIQALREIQRINPV